MQQKAIKALALIALLCLVPAAGLALTTYTQDFELMLQTDSTALSSDGWVVYGNVYDTSGSWLYGYGTYPAPNHSLAFSNVALNEGGDDQGYQQLSIFSDYENLDHASGYLIESNVFQEQSITSADVGTVWRFSFQAKMGNLSGASTAAAFIKTIDPSSGYAMTNLVSVDMTAVPTTWGGYSVELDIIEDLVGQLFQFGFMCEASNYESSGIFYDNLVFEEYDPTDASTPAAGVVLRPNYPNPFNPSTRIEFALETAGSVDLSIYDLSGRRVATLERGVLPAGDHAAVWNGRADDGSPVASGQYRYVLETAEGRTSRSLVLLK